MKLTKMQINKSRSIIMENTFSKRYTNITKGVAIILMMLHHCFLSVDRFENYTISFFPFKQELVVLLAKSGKCCVGIFTFLSAYGLTRSYLKKKSQEISLAPKEFYGKFVLRRYFNLLSGFIVIYLIAFIGSCFLTDKTPIVIYCKKDKTPLTFAFYMVLDLLGLSRIVGTSSLINTWWYMGLALTIIFLFPMVMELYKYFGWLIIPAYFCLYFSLDIGKGEFVRWLFLLPVGIWFAECNILEKCKIYFNGIRSCFFKILLFFCSSLLLFIICIYFGMNYECSDYSIIFLDLILTLGVIIWTYLFLCEIHLLARILEFIGRHSMNIFLIHSFLRVRWFPDHIYSFSHFLLVMSVLLIESTLISIAVEWVKKRSGYSSWIKNYINRVCG